MQDPKKSPKIAIWAPSHNFVRLYLRNQGTYRQSEKNLSSNMSSRCPHTMVNIGPLTAEIGPVVWGTPANFYRASLCKRCTSYGNSVCPSVRPSVRPSVTRRYCVKTMERSTVQFALLDSKMCLVLRKPKNIPHGQPLPHEIFARTDLQPLLIAASLDTFCLVAPQS